MNKNKMQTFRVRLCQTAEVFDPQTEALAQLTHLSPAQMRSANLEDWGVWG